MLKHDPFWIYNKINSDELKRIISIMEKSQLLQNSVLRGSNKSNTHVIIHINQLLESPHV